MREGSPCTTRTDVRTEGEPRGRAYVDRAVEQAEKETPQHYRPPQGKAAVLTRRFRKQEGVDCATDGWHSGRSRCSDATLKCTGTVWQAVNWEGRNKREK